MKVFCLLLLIGATCVIAEIHADPLDKSPTDTTPPLLQENKRETDLPTPQTEPTTEDGNQIAYNLVGMVALLAPEEDEDGDAYLVRLAITGLLSILAIVLMNILSPTVLMVLALFGLVLTVVGFVESDHKVRYLKRMVAVWWLTYMSSAGDKSPKGD